MSAMTDTKNRVCEVDGKMSVDGVLICTLPILKIQAAAMLTIAHAVFYTKLSGPCKALYEVLYKSVGFDIELSCMASKVWGDMAGEPTQSL